MKRLMLILWTVALSLVGYAQQDSAPVRFGFLSYTTVLQAMPEYATVEANVAQLRQQYEAEQKRVEDDFNKKYEEFLDGQKDFPKTILQKRQSELQEMLDKNIAFKKESQRLLAAAETEAKAPLKARLNQAIQQVGMTQGLAFILDTDQQATLFLHPDMGVDVTDAVKQLLTQTK